MSASQQVKLRFAPTDESSKDIVSGLGKKHLLDLTLKVRSLVIFFEFIYKRYGM